MEMLSPESGICTSYTDGKDIYLYLFSSDIDEEDSVEIEINYRFIHELIHMIDMSILEIQVLRMTYSVLQ